MCWPGRGFWEALLLVIVVQPMAIESQGRYIQIYPPVNETDGRTPLYFALVLSFGGDVVVSKAALPGVQIALDYINSEPSILPGYSLHYTLTDSQVPLSMHQLCVVFMKLSLHRK